MKYNIATSELIEKVKFTEEKVIPVNYTIDGVKTKVYLDWVITIERKLYKTKKGNYFEHIIRTSEPVQGNYKHLANTDQWKIGLGKYPEIFYNIEKQLGHLD